jgi:hypothetical protein
VSPRLDRAKRPAPTPCWIAASLAWWTGARHRSPTSGPRSAPAVQRLHVLQRLAARPSESLGQANTSRVPWTSVWCSQHMRTQVPFDQPTLATRPFDQPTLATRPAEPVTRTPSPSPARPRVLETHSSTRSPSWASWVRTQPTPWQQQQQPSRGSPTLDMDQPAGARQGREP